MSNPNIPSSNLMNTTVALARLTGGQDADGGTDGAYGSPYMTVKAIAQCTATERSELDDGRVTTVGTWLMGFSLNPHARVDDLATFTLYGTAHSVLLDGVMDAGGQGEVWEVTGVERT